MQISLSGTNLYHVISKIKLKINATQYIKKKKIKTCAMPYFYNALRNQTKHQKNKKKVHLFACKTGPNKEK